MRPCNLGGVVEEMAISAFYLSAAYVYSPPITKNKRGFSYLCYAIKNRRPVWSVFYIRTYLAATIVAFNYEALINGTLKMLPFPYRSFSLFLKKNILIKVDYSIYNVILRY